MYVRKYVAEENRSYEKKYFYRMMIAEYNNLFLFIFYVRKYIHMTCNLSNCVLIFLVSNLIFRPKDLQN